MRLILAMLCALLSLALASASVAHAVESSACAEQVAAHDERAPADDDRDGKVDGRPDGHLNCHGHQLASLPAAESRGGCPCSESTPPPARARVMVAASSDPALRPPRA